MQVTSKLLTKRAYVPSIRYSLFRSFLEGLLRKDYLHRVPWPKVLSHDYLQDELSHLATQEEDMFSPLTAPLSDRKELAKEMQRASMAKAITEEWARKGVARGQPLLRMAQEEKNRRQQRSNKEADMQPMKGKVNA